jgi:hypothetical protein
MVYTWLRAIFTTYLLNNNFLVSCQHTKIIGLAKIILKIKGEKVGKLFDFLVKIKKNIVTKCQNTRKLCMFRHRALIMYMFSAPMTSHVSLVIQHIPCSFVINYMT